jgi:hypothetical protein
VLCTAAGARAWRLLGHGCTRPHTHTEEREARARGQSDPRASATANSVQRTAHEALPARVNEHVETPHNSLQRIGQLARDEWRSARLSASAKSGRTLRKPGVSARWPHAGAPGGATRNAPCLCAHLTA